MPYDPAMPQPGDDLAAAPLRNQFNALNDLITALDARIAALEPVTHTATGFPEAGALGVLTQVGTMNGKPFYKNGTGYFIFWSNAGSLWIMVDADPRPSEPNVGRYYNPANIVTGQWVQSYGQAPAGTVS